MGRLELAHNGCVDALRRLLSKRLELVQLMLGADTLKTDWEQARCTAWALHGHCTGIRWEQALRQWRRTLLALRARIALHAHRLHAACAMRTACTLRAPCAPLARCARHAHRLHAAGAQSSDGREAVAARGAARDGGSSRRAADARVLLQAAPRGARPLRGRAARDATGARGAKDATAARAARAARTARAARAERRFTEWAPTGAPPTVYGTA